MSEGPQGPGWWQASDDAWYPPELHPDAPKAGDSGRETARFSGPPSMPPTPGPDSGPPQPPPVQPPQPPQQSAGGQPPQMPAQYQVPAGHPAGAPPGGPPGTAPASGSRGGRLGVIVATVAATLLVVALVIGGLLAWAIFAPDTALASVLLEPLDEPGPDAFTDPAAPVPAGSLRDYADHGVPADADPEELAGFFGVPSEAGPTDDAQPLEATTTGYVLASGDAVGLYGGTLDEAACDIEQLADFLSADAQKAAAWAGVVGIDPEEISSYLDGLTPVNLGGDTRVTNHGFVDGVATPRESVLQRGSAVLVDDRGVPRVRCYCGNPLLESVVADAEEYRGTAWASFDPEDVRLVDAAEEPLDEFTLIEVGSGSPLVRPAGSVGDRDRLLRPEPEPEPAPEPEPGPEPELEPDPDLDPDAPARVAEEICGQVSKPLFDSTFDSLVVLPADTDLTCESALHVGEGVVTTFVDAVEGGDDSVFNGFHYAGWDCVPSEQEASLVCEAPPGQVILREP